MHDLSVTAIHHAVQLPTDPASVKCQQALAEANASTIDHVLKRILSHLHHRNERWPPRRLFRCLDYITQHCPPTIIQLRSFRSCVKAALDHLAAGTTEQSLRHETNTESMHAVIKFIGSVLEHRIHHDVLLNDIRRSRGMMYVLQWAGACPKLESSCLRTLVAKGKYFAKDLIAYDAFWILAGLVTRVPDLLVNDPTKVYLCVKAARIFENLISFAKSSRADPSSREKAVSFVHSVNFIPVARSWQVSSSHFLENPTNSMARKLMHSLTSIVSSCIAVSEDAAASFSTIEAARVWRSALSHDMKTFLNHIRQQQLERHTCITTTAAMDEIATRMLRIARIALSVAVYSVKGGPYRRESADELTQDITVFLLLLGLNTVLPEQYIAILGTPVTASMNALFGEYHDFEHGIINNAELFKSYQDFFVVLLECYIQHLQLASEWLVSGISGYISYFLTNAMATLKDDEQPESPVQARLRKLISYFLHYDKAVEVFVTAPAHLNDTIWSPTIQSALDGITLYVDDNVNHTKDKRRAVLYKANRAFSALRAATKHPNACARMEQAGALQMVNINYIPNIEELEPSVSLLNMYASFTHFIAAMARTMALVRVKLRQDFPIGPVIMKLLWQANRYTFSDDATGWTHVVSGSLMVVSAFEFDIESLQKWLSWPVSTIDDDTGWISTVHTSSNRLSVLPVVLQALLPERNNWKESLQKRISTSETLLLHAVIAFNLLSMVPEAGIQLVRDHEAVRHLCETLMELSRHTRNSDSLSDTKPNCNDNIKLDEQEENEEQIPLVTKSPIMRCFDMLHRGLVRILTSRDNMNLIITSNVLTAFFQPLCTSMIELDSFKLELSRMLCQDISDERLHDYHRLFQFTVGDDNATKLHELCAVATAYACPNATYWDSVLGIRADEEVIQSKNVFGALCRMLMYDLLEQDSDNVHEAPYRRPAAAQAIEILAQVLTPLWVADREDIVAQLRQRDRPLIEDDNTMVALITQDSSVPVTTRRAPLVQQSTFFAALFSGEYAETASGEPIQLRDITRHALTMFLEIIDRGTNAVLPDLMSWYDVADVLLTADRFGSESVRVLCEEWISLNLVNKEDNERLDGAILLFRLFRDPSALDAGISSDVWPFQKILIQALMVAVSELSASARTVQFSKMVGESDAAELSSFCQAMVVLMCSSIRGMDQPQVDFCK